MGVNYSCVTAGTQRRGNVTKKTINKHKINIKSIPCLIRYITPTAALAKPPMLAYFHPAANTHRILCSCLCALIPGNISLILSESFALLWISGSRLERGQ